MNKILSSKDQGAHYTQNAVEMPGHSASSSHQAFEQLVSRAVQLPGLVPVGIVWPCEQHALEGAMDAAQRGIIEPVLVGDKGVIVSVAQASGIALDKAVIVDVATPAEAAQKATALVRDGRVKALMKGSLHTDLFMHAIVEADSGLRTSRRISHVFVLAVPDYEDLLFVTDAAINIFPDLDVKRDIVQNAIDLHNGLGLGAPRVAVLSAVETVNSKIPGTVDAACLCKMAERGQICGGVLDGPLAMDNAISLEAAKIKKIVSPVAGRAQVLVAPDLESGNMLAKNMIFMSGADSAGIVLGASVP
ncbi:bifunctional enoyl-CoA hydratase/phosphate acetyltransferase, partial [Acetobacter pomorum]